jgi:hypothetical protein
VETSFHSHLRLQPQEELYKLLRYFQNHAERKNYFRMESMNLARSHLCTNATLYTCNKTKRSTCVQRAQVNLVSALLSHEGTRFPCELFMWLIQLLPDMRNLYNFNAVRIISSVGFPPPRVCCLGTRSASSIGLGVACKTRT